MEKCIKVVISTIFLIIVSCAVITVNIYFPEKEVKEAYKKLEEELMRSNDKEGNSKKTGTESSIKDFLFPYAYAQDKSLADKIAEIVKKMPDVVNAYKEMGARIKDIDRLRDSGIVGEGNNGLLVHREGQLSESDKKLVDDENDNRMTVMKGMAKAIIRINRLPENEENLKKVMPQAIDQFASIRRESAKKGWWIQDADGNWGRK